VPKGKHVSVQEGDYVKAGDPLVDGPRVPHDILRVLGVEALANYLVNEIQDVYRLQGVKINDKHIEVIVRPDAAEGGDLDPGDTTFLVGEQVDRIEFDIENEKRHRAKERPGAGRAGAAGHHQGLAADQLLHLGRLVPGDDAVLHRGGCVGQGGHARGAQGERHRWAPDPAGTGSVMNRLRALAAQRDRGRLPGRRPAGPAEKQQAAE
jgi:DNA-directed RNA polymerase subunit beta'